MVTYGPLFPVLCQLGFLNNVNRHALNTYNELDTVLSTFSFSLIKCSFSTHHASCAGKYGCGIVSTTDKAAAFMELIFDTNKQMRKSVHTEAGVMSAVGKHIRVGKGSDLLLCIRNDPQIK